MRKLLVFLVVVGLVAVIGDRVAEKFATDEAQRRLVSAGLTAPQVDVRGFPFVTQLLARRFDDVHVSTSAVRIGTGHANQVSGTARDVRVPSSGPAIVGQLTARGTVPYAEVLRQVHHEGLVLRSAGAGQVQVRRTVSVLGRSVAVIARGRVSAHGNKLVVTPTAVKLASGASVGSSLSGVIADQLSFAYRIRGLPDGVHIDRITPASSGFVVDVSGRDVRLAT
jgi:hypothetical protein